MLSRERDLPTPPHPTVRDLTAAVGAPLFVCAATGSADITAPAETAHCRGGFFCDEPVCPRVICRSTSDIPDTYQDL